MAKLKILLALSLSIIAFTNISAQEVLMTIDNKEISLDEFERIYNKNNKGIASTMQTPEEYMELFINFKLKVLEAENLGMDTTQKFLEEFNGYKEQLAKPYLDDEETKLAFMKEAYERMKYDLHVRHILLKIPNHTPEDTLARYNLAMKIRQRILDGEDFETVARATSEDPTAKTNGGDLGFFTVFTFPYPFETAAYNIDVGEISLPTKTIYGYNIIQKLEQRPARGQVKVAHIFLRATEGLPDDKKNLVKERIDALYDSILLGKDFATLAMNYSEDKASGRKGGEIPWFETGKMIKKFESAAFGLKNIGDYSKPFQTSYGFHILKLLDKKEIGTYEEMESTLQSKAFKGDRSLIIRRKYAEKLKEQYSYKLNDDVYKTLYDRVDTSIYEATWDPNKNPEGLDEILYSYDGGEVKLSHFTDYLFEKQNKRPTLPISVYVDNRYNRYLEEFLTNLKKEDLPELYPEYKYILQEYHDGILLFDLMDQKVWTKAVNDTLGLEKFFKENRKKYMWEERTEAIIVSCDSSVDINSIIKKAPKISSGKLKQAKLNKMYCSDTVDCISLEKIIVESGKNEHVDALNGKFGAGEVYSSNGKSNFVITLKRIPPEEKGLDDTRGQVTSDYQDYLEKQWIEELRKKYEVNVNKDLLSKIEY